MAAGPATETAPAKVNLSLHVVGRRRDGYHLLDGLAAFTAFGDRLSVAEADRDSIEIDGPMAPALRGQVNILERVLSHARDAARQVGQTIPPLHVRLEKNLPVAAGIGGGSADAAALLRVLAARRPQLRTTLFEGSVCLGADVPMCLSRAPVRVEGIGDRVTPLAACPALAIVLVNPGVPLSTPAVFSALHDPSFEPPPAVPDAGFASFEAAASYLDRCRNDLQAPAAHFAPEIEETLARLRQAGSRIARMSGSGATCFGLFESRAKAEAARETLAAAYPQGFVVATTTFAAETGTPTS